MLQTGRICFVVGSCLLEGHVSLSVLEASTEIKVLRF